MQLPNLNTNFLGRNCVYYDTIDSTQAEIWRLYETNIENGTLVFAGIQTSGRGTHGRKWYTDKSNNIAFSFYINLKCDVKKLEGLTSEIAQIIITILKNKYNIDLNIKEPNDIIYNGKKVGGILTETKVIGNIASALVIGIGINTSQKSFAKEIKNIATSINNEFNININVEDFIASFCNEFEKKIIERIENR